MKTFSVMSITDFKQKYGYNKLTVVRNPHTGKLFVASGNGANYRCQQNLNTEEPLAFVSSSDDGEEENWCLINDTKGVNVVVTL